jgi:glutathione S-transferase
MLYEGADFTLEDSNAILKYLAESRRSVPRSWYPADIKKRAEIEEILEWCQCHWRYNFNMGYRHATHDTLEGSHKYAYDGVKLNCESLETIITKAKGVYITGANPTIADLQVFFAYQDELDQGRNFDQDYPKIKAWAQKMLEIKEVKEQQD